MSRIDNNELINEWWGDDGNSPMQQPIKDPMRSVSVIMPSYLGHFRNSASDRKTKFLRAVKSFIYQTFTGDKELIIISDGCEDTKRLYQTFFKDNKEINLLSLPKQVLFSGIPRDKGLKAAKYNFIAYLDSDDYFNPSHLDSMLNQIMHLQRDWVYYSDWIRKNKRDTILRDVTVKEGSIGTSSICHKKELTVSWNGLDGYGHDWQFVQQLKKVSDNYCKIHGCGYTVCHTVNGVDY